MWYFHNIRPNLRRFGSGILVAAVWLGLATAAQATDYSEVSIVTASYIDTDGHTYLSYRETADLSSVASAPTDIGALTLGSNFITGATIPYGPIINAMTGELAHQDSDYVTFTVPTGDVLSNLYLVAPAQAATAASFSDTTPVLDGTSIQPGDLFFIGLASGAKVAVTPPSSAGLLGFALLSSSAIGSDILPAIGSLAGPPYFRSPPFGGATTFTGALPAGTYSLWLLDGNNPVSYKLDLQVAAVPEPACWAMYIVGFALAGQALRHRRRLAAVRA